MNFIDKFKKDIFGQLSCFDRMIFRGYLTSLFQPSGIGYYLSQCSVLLKNFKSFLLESTALLKKQIEQLSALEDVPLIYLTSPQVSKEKIVTDLLKSQPPKEGLIAIIKVLELCQSVEVRGNKATKKLEVVHSWRKCLHYYLYYVDKEFGLMHVRIQSWLPYTIQIYINGREYLKRALAEAGICYRSYENSISWVCDLAKAQQLADKLENKKWDRFFDVIANGINPLLAKIVAIFGSGYKWCLYQCEYATDVLYKSREQLEGIFPQLLEHSSLFKGGEDILTFFGRKVHGNFKGEVITDRKRFSQGFRVKHRLSKNSIKMYDKDNVLRIETTINNPKLFKIYKTVTRNGQQTKAWVPMGKSVPNLYRYAQVSMTANEKYLNSLCVIDIGCNIARKVEKLCNRVITKTKTGSNRSIGGFNLLKEETCLTFEAINDSRFCLKNFRNQDLRELLIEKGVIRLKEKTKESLKKASNKITRLISKLRSHKLIAKIPRSFCYRVTKSGMEIITRILKIRKVEILALG